MKPFFSYYGGKQRMSHKIIPLIPKHTVYVEPFAGGASILFMKPFPKVKNSNWYREVINDINSLVYNFYKQLRDNPQELQRLINATSYCERTFDECKRICRGDIEISDVRKAWAFFVNINMAFSNNLSGGWMRGVFGRNSSYSWYSKIDNLNRFLNRMQGVHISNTDALKCIKYWDSPQTFFYIDPPYVGSANAHYSGYTQQDLDRLIDLLLNIDGSFILSGYDNDSYPNIWERFEFDRQMVAASWRIRGIDRKRKEIVLRHITEKPVRSEIRKIYRNPAFSCFSGESVTENGKKYMWM